MDNAIYHFIRSVFFAQKIKGRGHLLWDCVNGYLDAWNAKFDFTRSM